MSDDTATMLFRLSNALRDSLGQIGSFAATDDLRIGDIPGLWGALTSEEMTGLSGQLVSELLGESPEFIREFIGNKATVNRDTARHFVMQVMQYLAHRASEMEDAYALTTEKGARLTTEDGNVLISDAPPRDNGDTVDYGEKKSLIAEYGDFPIEGRARQHMHGESNIVRPVRWARVASAPEAHAAIQELERLLPELIRRTRFTNLDPGELGITDEQRSHLIEILETALALLKAPMMEIGLLEAAYTGLLNVRQKITEKGTEYIALGMIMGTAEEIGKLLPHLL